MNKLKSRRALGRGLSHLIPLQPEETDPERDIVRIDAHAVRPNPFQPRTRFDTDEIDRLAESIQSQGLLQPVLVRRSGQHYEIISGERRFRALRKLGNGEIPCIIKEDVHDRDMLEMSLVENIQREQLNEVEKARAYRRLLLECDLSHEQLSSRIGRSRSVITNTMRLLKLPDEVLTMLESGALSAGHARALLAVEGEAGRKAAAKRICEGRLSVREAEEMTRSRPQQKGTAARKPSGGAEPRPDPDIESCIERMQYKFGTPVSIRGSRGGRGVISIRFFSREDLERIFSVLFEG